MPLKLMTLKMMNFAIVTLKMMFAPSSGFIDFSKIFKR